ncbi:hypothetical protein LTR78_010541 [Recurvomyces mirabilis]|uniref:Beta-lactamase-related domain-containing protein n=1 Tax=Recurvomyces mirabilis TaxID=574656 RepID=A0AAE0TQB0_9PEZI|nr:hypothetical protein LTR78_010541 [Recurvomyces mirabilis]KAK5149591.1 hypothetical protein LTS14_010793 [Recurvomyces mirabilis]
MGTTNDDTPLLTFANNPTVYNTTGAQILTTDTQFIVASVSKLFTAYAMKLLSNKVAPTDRVTKFIPELLHLKGQPVRYDGIASTNWSSISIEALLTHLSGITSDLGDSDIDNTPGNHSALGLPPHDATDSGTQCGAASNPYQRACTEADFLNDWGRKFPVYAPYTTLVYSNMGFAILGLVIGRVTGSSYAQFMQKAVFDPLGLDHSSVDHPLNLNGTFITQQTADGDLSEGFLAPSGAIYSTSSDLYNFGRSILASKQLPSTTTRAWLKPKAFTSSAGTFVGEVWEIAAGTDLTAASDGHIVHVYTKGGNLNLYSSIIALVPDYDFAFALTSAGSETGSGTVEAASSQVLDAIVPALEAANKAAAKERFAGTYSAGGNRITLPVDEEPGLLVTKFSVNGVESVIDAVGEFTANASPGQTELRLYPTDLAEGATMAWQGVFDSIPADVAEVENQAFFWADATCQSWSELTTNSYGLAPLDQFLLTATVMAMGGMWRSLLGLGGLL